MFICCKFLEEIARESVFTHMNVNNYHEFLKDQPIEYPPYTVLNLTYKTVYKYY